MKLRPALAASCFAAAAALHSNVCSAEEFDFTLTPSAEDPFSGSGYFDVDTSALPSSGTGNLEASFIEFTLSGRKFGTDFGSYMNTFNTFTNTLTVTTLPQGPATVSFVDGLAVGVGYDQQHLCQLVPFAGHCGTYDDVSLEGAFFTAFMYPAGQKYIPPYGTLSITEAIPEPSTYALLLVGLVGMALKGRRGGKRSELGAPAI